MAYIVLTAEERAKGFVRPVRQKYVHVGRSVCGTMMVDDSKMLGGPRFVCTRPHMHAGACGEFKDVVQPDHADMLRTHRIGGCGIVTHMGLALAETYARDPKFYDGTFCVGCKTHFPLDQFVWDGTDEAVGS